MKPRKITIEQYEEIKEWLKRGVCRETAEIMAGVKQTNFSGSCSGSEQPLLQEERVEI